MEDVLKTLESLKVSCDEGKAVTPDTTVQNLEDIIKELKQKDDAERQKLTDGLLQEGIIRIFISLLKSAETESPALLAKVAETIAEIAKTESARKPLTEESLVKPLIELLSHKDNDVVLQTCRALGNICYDNDVARSLIKGQDGVKKLVDLLRRLLQMETIPVNLRMVASGCLLNLTDTYEQTQEQALKDGIVEVLLQYLQKYHDDEDIATHSLLVLNCLADTETGRVKLAEQASLSVLVSVLDGSMTDDVLETLLELLGSLAEDDEVKERLVLLGVCEKLLAVLKNFQKGTVDEDSHNIMKTIFDLLVLILTGDTSMEILYKGGEGVIFKESVQWLQSSNENIQVAGALALGNFARKDSHCIQMVSQGIPKYLLALLDKHNTPDGDIRMQHAVLSALRNLAIPAENKGPLIHLGLVDRILPMTSIETFPVVFKLLGTLRMLVDNQESVATSLGQNRTFLKRLITWCATDDHPGVKGEATRLLAWITKNSKSKPVMMCMLEEGAVHHLVSMVTSEHTVMQNEALIALVVMASIILDELSSELVSLNFSRVIQKQMTSFPETLLNGLNLVKLLMHNDGLKKEFMKADFINHLKSLTTHTSSEVQGLAKSLVAELEASSSK